MKTLVEVCCGSAEDVVTAQLGGADRVELNSALFLGGLTPTLATLDYVKSNCTIPIISMVRSRGAGFCYSDIEMELMLKDAEELLKHGTDGLAFGALTQDRQIDIERTRAMVELAHKYGKELVIHRAFDCVDDPFRSIEELIDLKVDRILTSGNRAKAIEGKEILKELNQRYGDKIELLLGGGVNATNAIEIMDYTGIRQIHSSCKAWMEDPTTHNAFITYAYGDKPAHYEVVDLELVKGLVQTVSD